MTDQNPQSVDKDLDLPDGSSLSTRSAIEFDHAGRDDKIAFDSADYATREEAFVGLENFLMKAFGVSDEDE